MAADIAPSRTNLRRPKSRVLIRSALDSIAQVNAELRAAEAERHTPRKVRFRLHNLLRAITVVALFCTLLRLSAWLTLMAISVVVTFFFLCVVYAEVFLYSAIFIERAVMLIAKRFAKRG